MFAQVVLLFALISYSRSYTIENVPLVTKGQNSISGVNYIFFFGNPKDASYFDKISEDDISETGKKYVIPPFLKQLFSRKADEETELETKENNRHHRSRFPSLRLKRSAEPTYYKKGYGGGGGGGGCCNTCGQCGGGCSGGGCGGGGNSGSYSQSSSYSSSSSGSYSSGYGRKK